MGSKFPVFSLLMVLLLLIFSTSFAQQLEEEVKVELVQIDLVATDRSGGLVTDLKKEEFTLKENGKVQNLTHFYNSSEDDTRYPLTILFLVDTSYSMHEKVAGLTRIDIAVQAAELIMDELQSSDQVELIEFNDKQLVLVPFTSDDDEVREKFDSLNFREANTAMHDSVLFALERMTGKSGRKIIVIFSDGMDSASKSTEDDVIEAIRKSDATILTFYSEFARLNFPSAGGGLGGNPSGIGRVRIRAGEDVLKEYTEMTGGQFFSFRKEPELLKAMENFRAFVQSQYTLAYSPADSKKTGWRKIKVECKRKGIKLKYREGYWAG